MLALRACAFGQGSEAAEARKLRCAPWVSVRTQAEGSSPWAQGPGHRASPEPLQGLAYVRGALPEATELQKQLLFCL